MVGAPETLALCALFWIGFFTRAIEEDVDWLAGIIIAGIITAMVVIITVITVGTLIVRGIGAS